MNEFDEALEHRHDAPDEMEMSPDVVKLFDAADPASRAAARERDRQASLEAHFGGAMQDILGGSGNWARDLLGIHMAWAKHHGFRSQAQNLPLLEEYATAREPRRSQLYEEIVLRNLLLVARVAFKYVNMGRRAGMDLNDLVQWGSIGLMRAVEGYKVELGFHFSTYATSWIRQAITRAIMDETDQDQPGRIPVHMRESMSKVAKVRERLTTPERPAPSAHEIYLELKREAQEAGRQPLTLKQVGRAMRLSSQEAFHLDDPIPYLDDSGDLFHEIIADQTIVDAATALSARREAGQMRQIVLAVEGCVERLPARQAQILTMRLGLFGTESQTLEEVGSRYGITRERIRQIENNAIDRIEAQLGLPKEDLLALLRLSDALETFVRAT